MIGEWNMSQKQNISNNNRLNFPLSETEEIIARLKAALDVKSDGHLAKYLGITRQNIGAARKRDDVPPGWIYKVAELSGCSMDWLRFGQGPQKRVPYSMGKTSDTGELSSQDSPYRLHVSWKPRTANDLQNDADRAGFGTAVEMLAKIYSSEDPLLIDAINTDLRAFCEAIDRQQREQQSTRELIELKKRLATIEKEFKREKPS
jgi:hypothetical protein